MAHRVLLSLLEMEKETKMNKIFSSVFEGERFWNIDDHIYWAERESKWPLEIFMKITAWKKMFDEEY